MTTLNIALLNKTLDAIVADPESWDQRDFLCGTKMCLAGHALIQSGEYKIQGNQFVNLDTDKAVSAEEVGEELLGLTYEQTEALFYLIPGSTDDEGNDTWAERVGV